MKSSLAKIFQGKHQLCHLHSLAGGRLPLLAPYFLLSFQVIEVDDFIFQYFFNHEVKNLIKVYQVATDKMTRKLTQKLIIATALIVKPECVFDLFFLAEPANLEIEQIQLFLSVSSQFQNCLRLLLFTPGEVPFSWRIDLRVLYVVLKEFLLDFPRFPFLSLVSSPIQLLLREY